MLEFRHHFKGVFPIHWIFRHLSKGQVQKAKKQSLELIRSNSKGNFPSNPNDTNPSVRYDHKVKYSSDETRSFKEGHFDIFFKKLCECYQGHFFGLTPPL